MEKTLNLTFEDAGKSKTTISLDAPKGDLTKETLKQAAQELLAAGVLVNSKNLPLVAIAAANVTTKTVEVFEVV